MTTSNNMVKITGNTYPVREGLKALGGRWNAAQKAWMVPDQRLNEARKLIAGTRSNSTGTPASSMPRTGGPWAGARGGVRHAQGVTRRPDNCESCGAFLPAGQGRLEYCVEDSGCMRHHDEGGYHVYCLDATTCTARHLAAREAANAKKDLIQRAKASLDALLSACSATDEPSWATDAPVIATWREPAMCHTGAIPTLRFRVDTRELYYHVPGYFACDWDNPALHRVGILSEEQIQSLDAVIGLGREAKILRA